MVTWFTNLRNSLEGVIFSFRFRKIITRYRRICYNLNVMRQSACLVSNPVFFCDCTARIVSNLVGIQIVGFLTHRLIFKIFHVIFLEMIYIVALLFYYFTCICQKQQSYMCKGIDNAGTLKKYCIYPKAYEGESLHRQ